MTDTLPPDCQVTLTTHSGATFTGVVHSIDDVSGKIVLKSVTTSGSKLYGLQNFYRKDLTNFQLLNESIGTSNQKSVASKSEGTFASKKTVPKHLLELESLDTDELAMANIFREDNGDQGFGSGEDGSVVDNEDYYNGDGYILICKVCEKFFEAILFIMDQEVVGVTFQGVNIGRDGTLSLIEVATETSIFIFDMLKLGQQAFDEGLQALFEASNVVKVIHDCRWISDMLHEKYNINMVNIFDTQVANAFVYKLLHNGDWPRYVESLPSCLVKHLNLSLEKVNFLKIRERLSEKDQSVWLQRPLPGNLLLGTMKNAGYLIQLYQVLMNKLLCEFRMGVEIYTNHVRKMNGEIESCRMHGHFLPYIFLEIPKLVNHAFADNRDVFASKSCQKGFQDNCFNITDKQIIFSHNSTWHRSRESEKFRKDSQTIRKGKEADTMDCVKHTTNKTCNTRNVIGDGSENCIEDSRLSRNRSLQLSNEKRQDSVTCLNGENSNVNHQGPNSWLSHTRDTDCSSAIDVNNQAEFKKFHENKSNSDLSGPKNNGERQTGMYTSYAKRQELTPDVSENSLQTHKSENTERLNENDLPTKNIHDTPVELSSHTRSGIRHSKLWQAVHARKMHKTSELSSDLSTSSEHSDQHAILSSSALAQDLIHEKVCQPGKKAREAFQKLASPSSVHATESAVNRSSFESSDCDESQVTPHLLDLSSISNVSSLSKSCLNKPSNSDTESSLAVHVPNKMDMHENESDSFSFVPAGFLQLSVSKKKMKEIQDKRKSTVRHELNETVYLSTSPLDDDFGYIPMQGSLKRQKEVPLGGTFDVEDPFSDTECSLQHSNNPQSVIESHLAVSDEGAVKNSDIEDIRQSKILQKALKMTSSFATGNLQHKLLPPKTSPSGCSILSKH